MVKLLLRHKANTKIQTTEGKIPLYAAIMNKNFDIAKLLFDMSF